MPSSIFERPQTLTLIMQFDNNQAKFDTCTVKGSYFVQPLFTFLNDVAFSDHFRIMQKILQVLIAVIGNKHFFCVLLNFAGTFVNQKRDPSWQRIPKNCFGGIILLPPPRHTLTFTCIYKHIEYLRQHDTNDLGFSFQLTYSQIT